MSQKPLHTSSGATASGNTPSDKNDATSGPVGADPEVDMQVEIFRTRSRLLAQMIVDDILAAEGVVAVIHDRQMHSLPAPLAMSGEIGIAVSEIDREVALSALREAAQNGVPLDDGEIVEESVG